MNATTSLYIAAKSTSHHFTMDGEGPFSQCFCNGVTIVISPNPFTLRAWSDDSKAQPIDIVARHEEAHTCYVMGVGLPEKDQGLKHLPESLSIEAGFPLSRMSMPLDNPPAV